jgi:hypothetical protein
MHLRFKELGHAAWIILVGAFLVLRPLFEYFSREQEDLMKKHINGAALLVAGLLTFLIVARADKKNGIEVFSRRAWTSDLLLSQHLCFSIPMRLFGVVLIGASLFF